MKLGEEVTEPDARCAEAYGGYYQVSRSLSPVTRVVMSRLTELVAGSAAEPTPG